MSMLMDGEFKTLSQRVTHYSVWLKISSPSKYHYSGSTEETFRHDFLVILKQTLQNYKKIVDG